MTNYYNFRIRYIASLFSFIAICSILIKLFGTFFGGFFVIIGLMYKIQQFIFIFLLGKSGSTYSFHFGSYNNSRKQEQINDTDDYTGEKYYTDYEIVDDDEK